MKKTLLALALGATALLTCQPASEAAQRKSTVVVASEAGEHPKSRYYRKRATRVRGYVARRVGGYSYSPEDVINTYGNSRTLFGTTNSYRDPYSDRQTPSGPFDHGFFFDSGIGARGGNAPYPN